MLRWIRDNKTEAGLIMVIVVCALILVAVGMQAVADVKACVASGRQEWECRAIVNAGSRASVMVVH